ncbi:hypothetical protein [Mucilaginibacter sp.]|uniref:hypothetical protein n=1 Tax=Mucilaginibacter sp. TaxID=1882438 RepID=UPI0025D5B6F9|nr:hypothetical protein [Mucilaginibacter sp.]
MAIVANIIITNTTSPSNDQVYGDAHIFLTDSETGQPTNGNNVVVTFTQNVNGNISERKVTMPGQSIKIFAGLIADSMTGYFVSFSTPQIGTVPDPQPPVNVCDLKINFIHVDKPESAPGAADAQITINASSSYGPVIYSTDIGTTWQVSPIFSNLSGGIVSVEVKDTNSLGCTAYGSISIPTLSDLLTSDPSVTLSGGNVSRWNAAFNPVVFTYQRKDFSVSGITADNETGYANIAVNTTLTNLAGDYLVKAGDKIYLNAGLYQGVYEIVKPYTYNQLIIKTPFTGNGNGFININNLRPYYKVITQITYMDKLTDRQETITSNNRPDGTGLIKADLSNFLQSLLRPADTSDYTQTNFRDDNLSASYQIKYAEHWDDGTPDGHTSDFVSISHPYYVVYAAKQLGDRYGGNLAEFVPFASISDPTQRARWITDFAEPAYSIGYPFDIGFIYSEELIGLPLYCELNLLDINRNPLAGEPQAPHLVNDDGSWLLNQDGGKYVIAGQSLLNIPVPGQLGLNRLLINSSFPREAFYFNLTLKYDDEHTTHTITQTQIVRIDDAVDDQSVYLRWIGLSGSWNYYRFVFNQELSLDVQNATIIKNYVHDWENQQGIEEVISKTAGQKMKLLAEDLSIADIKGLQSIKYSPKVQMLVNNNPVKWQTIVINSATFSEYETRNRQAPFSITFNMPSINIQTQ